ncbi:hypothetical protein [Mycolicibacterium mageritense]|uniref:hypothetical protein n=1 Tax=Mycolicibacterium mageritense TaxID=53462 RepID=UPI001E3ACAAA|nr:hypothetical protein [Mycolicibacterium mageritense]
MNQMIIHHVAFEWFPSVTDVDIAEFGTALAALPALLPELVSYTHGEALQLRPDSAVRRS